MMLRQVIKETKETELADTGSTLDQFNKWNSQVFINIKKYKIVFKIRKYLKIRLFVMAISNLCFNQILKYARLRKQ